MSLLSFYKHTNQNNRIIILNSVGAFVVKGAGLLVSLASMPAFIRYFNNNEVLGIWFTLLSVLLWFLNFDLGIGNGIRNQLTKDFTLRDYESAKATISSGFFSVGIVGFVLTIIGIVIISLTNLNWFFNITPQALSPTSLRMASLAIFIALMLRFVLTLVSSIFYALQKSACNNFLSLLVQVLQLVYVLTFHFQNQEEALVNLAISYIFITNLPMIIAGIYLFIKPLKACRPSVSFVNRQRVKQIVGIGVIFFACQILYMLIANTNEFLVTKFYGASCTAEYSFYYKVTSIVAMFVALAMTPIWSVVTKALAENNYVWLQKLYKSFLGIGIIIAVFQFLLVPFMQQIMDIWLGRGIIEVKTATALAFAVFGCVFIMSSMLSTIVCGMARMKTQLVCYTLGVILKFIVVFILHDTFLDWSIVVWSNVLVLFPYIIAQIIDLNIFFKKQTYESSTN